MPRSNVARKATPTPVEETPERPESGIEAAVRAVGSQHELARLLGCTQQNISFWLRRGYVPHTRAVEVEQYTGVPRTRLVDPRVVSLLDVSGR